jgi:predicted DNA-binding ribbon-helix-helix protein
MSTVSRQEKPMKSPVVKRSIVIAGHKTSVSLEDAFWAGLKEIAAKRDLTLSDMVAAIDQDRRHGNLSSAIRLFVLDYYRGAQHSTHAESKPSVITPGVGRSEQVLRAD